MNEQIENNEKAESGEYADFVSDYQRILAPKHLRTRILANAEDITSKSSLQYRRWLPVTASTALMLMVLFRIFSPESSYPTETKLSFVLTPSLAQASRLIPSKPSYSIPGLAQLSGMPSLTNTSLNMFELTRKNQLSSEPEVLNKPKLPSETDRIKRIL